MSNNNQKLPLLVQVSKEGHLYKGYGTSSYAWESGVFDWDESFATKRARIMNSGSFVLF